MHSHLVPRVARATALAVFLLVAGGLHAYAAPLTLNDVRRGAAVIACAQDGDALCEAMVDAAVSGHYSTFLALYGEMVARGGLPGVPVADTRPIAPGER